MRDTEFKNWLLSNDKDKRYVQNILSTCIRVEREFLIDLDYEDINLILDLLNYTREDERNLVQHKIKFKNGDYYNGLASLKRSVKKYKKFKEIFDLKENAENDSINFEKYSLQKTRPKQLKYRKELIEHWGKCSVTAFDKIGLLKASHIIPFSECDDNQKYDKNNGLLLVPNLDYLFDKFIISFEDSGEILISTMLSDFDLEILNINKNMRLASDKLNDSIKGYLNYHRSKFFEKEKSL